ncbi:MAG: GPI inositol deacylase [Thelocarpon superellum]|nr:MAG: GPI inositol deacylase [Thelocarpon superellum]
MRRQPPSLITHDGDDDDHDDEGDPHHHHRPSAEHEHSAIAAFAAHGDGQRPRQPPVRAPPPSRGPQLAPIPPATGVRTDSTTNGSSVSPALEIVPRPPPSPPPPPLKDMADPRARRRWRWRSPWFSSPLTLLVTALASLLLVLILHAFATRQIDVKGCRMSYMRPAFAKLAGFDTEHTRFASKYSLYLYREGMIDEDPEVKGVPVLFIPGNAGSYKQVRPIAAEAAQYFHDVVQHDASALRAGTRSLDFFTVDFNEDITAFHGQTLLDQAEYLNEAVAYILSLYHDPRRASRNPDLPDPSAVILLGHSMGGIVARTMLTMPNYQSNSINTIITMSAPHARPPVSFDADIVRTYKQINDYWRSAYAERWANNNPLWHVTLISIAGGGLDTVVPSDYASISSLVPDTNGFTVFTSSVPTVWSGMDHQSILWCDQFRKVIVRSLLDVVDVKRPSQTKPRADRMHIFRKFYLTGMESAEKALPLREPSTLLTLEDNSNSIISQGKRFTLRSFGRSKKPQAHLLPVPPRGTPGGEQFTLLTDQRLDLPGESGKLEVLLCSVFPLHNGQTASLFSLNMDLSGDGSGSTRLACKNAAVDVIALPASTRLSKYPFEEKTPFSYLQYDVQDIAEHQFVAIVDKAVEATPGWVIAEFSDNADSVIQTGAGLTRLLTTGLHLKLPATRPMVTDVKIPALYSSVLAYQLRLSSQACGDEDVLFTPLLRQYLSDPYESKYFVNVRQANINLHGIAPFMPPPMRARSVTSGVSLQIWSDPTCNTSIDLSLQVDVMGSLGKLVMRYRTVFAAFPLMIVALVLRKQFQVYDDTGIFISFSESMDLCLRRSLPMALLALSCLAVSLARAHAEPPTAEGRWQWRRNATESAMDFTKNDLLLGSQDSFFCFLVPLFGVISVAVCVLVNYAALALLHVTSIIYGAVKSRPGWLRNEDRRRVTTPTFATTSPRRRLITTSILLFFVSTMIPYQFAYMVACIVQISTCTRALRLARETRSGTHFNFYNYTHSILILMLWVLPINLPVLVVWVHNLAVHWLTPFSSHHNVLSIMPLILLVETLSGGKMLPRVTTRMRYVTSLLLLILAGHASIYGVTYAYMLHHLVNLVAAWLVALHLSCSTFPALTVSGLSKMLEGQDVTGSGDEDDARHASSSSSSHYSTSTAMSQLKRNTILYVDINVCIFFLAARIIAPPAGAPFDLDLFCLESNISSDIDDDNDGRKRKRDHIIVSTPPIQDGHGTTQAKLKLKLKLKLKHDAGGIQ